MGLSFCKYYLHCCCCLCKCCNGKPQNSVGIVPDKKLKLLLLGLSGSGKTEIAHYLSKTRRLDYDATNGVHNYCFKLMETMCSLTEIGGSDDMQRIWHHYFAGTMGIVYCFDISSKYNDLRRAFKLLQKIMENNYVAAKPILLVATKADLADESIQLYDIENTFQIQKIAVNCGSRIKLCCYDPRTENKRDNLYTNLRCGIDWMVSYMLSNYNVMQMRLNCDKNMQNWEQQRNKLVAEGKINMKKYKRFPKLTQRKKFWRLSHKRFRPRTAPAKISYVSTFSQTTMMLANSASSTTATPSSFQVPNDEVYVHNNENQTDI